MIEKPFGFDLESAQALNRAVLGTFDESQVFRIDHYLGKETVQNMLAFRFANGMFEPVWNRNYVDNVQIVAAEEVGVGTRASYYEHSGALRDLIQNHMLQLVALLCMEPPGSFGAESVRDEKVKVLEAIAAPSIEQVPGDRRPGAVRRRRHRRRGGAGLPRGGGGRPRLDHRDLRGAEARGLQLALGRCAVLPSHRQAPAAQGDRDRGDLQAGAAHAAAGRHRSDPEPNRLVMTIQPDEGVSLSLAAKVPGPGMRIRPVNMEFRYGTSFLSESPEAYERLILDAMRGDATLFTRDDEVEASWGICDPILKAWSQTPGPLASYPAGSAGPDAADVPLLAATDWRPL